MRAMRRASETRATETPMPILAWGLRLRGVAVVALVWEGEFVWCGEDWRNDEAGWPIDEDDGRVDTQS